METTWLVARREIAEHLRARSFRVITAILMVAVAAAVVIPALVAHRQNLEKVGVLGSSDPAIGRAALEAGRITGNRVSVVPVAGLEAARKLLRAGTVAAVVVNGSQVLIKQQPLAGTASSNFSLAGALAQLVGLERRLPAGTAEAALTGGLALPVRAVEPPPRNLTSRFTALGVNLLIYLAIFFYGMRIAQRSARRRRAAWSRYCSRRCGRPSS